MHKGLKMSDLLKVNVKGKDSYIGIMELDDLEEIKDMFYNEIEIVSFDNSEIFIIENTDENFEKLWNADYYDKGEKIAFSNCDYLGFTNG